MNQTPVTRPPDTAYQYRFTRRRYGNRSFFCWAEVFHDGEWVDLGDPWPGVNWPRKELYRVAREVVGLGDGATVQ